MSFLGRLKRIFLYSALIFVVIITVLFVLSAIFSEKIGERAVKALQQQIQTDVYVDNSRVSMFPYFPKAAIKLKGIFIQDTQGDTLALADELAFRVSIFDIISGNIELHTARLKGGIIHIKRLKDNSWNYNIFIQDTTEVAEENSMKFLINKAVLEHCDIHYVDEIDLISLQLFLLQTEVSLQYEDVSFAVNTFGKAILDQFSMEDQEYLKEKAIRFHIQFDGDTDGNLIEFNESLFEIAGNPFNIKGKITNEPKSSYYDLYFDCEQTGLAEILQLLPNEQIDLYGQLNPKGDANIQISYIGEKTNKKSPLLKIVASIEKAGLSNRRFETNLKDFSANMAFEMDHSRSVLHFDNTEGTLQKKPVHIKGEIDLLKFKGSSISLDGHVPIALLFNFAGIEGLEKGQGDIHFNQVVINSGATKNDHKSKGEISGNKIKGSFKGTSFNVPSIILELQGDLLSIKSFELTGWKSKIESKGTVSNWISWVFNEGTPIMNIELNADQLDLNQLLVLFEDEPADNQEIVRSDENTFQWKDQQMDLSYDLNKVYYKALVIPSLKGTLSLKNGVLNADTQANIFDGTAQVTTKGKITETTQIHAAVHAQNVDLHKLMKQCEEFDQDFITSANLKGKMESRMIIDMKWDEQGIFDEDHLTVKAAVLMEQGELIQVSMLEEFSTYVKIEDLRHIKFTKLHNLLEVKNRKLYIPSMFVQSNAINLTIGGQHSFDHQMDYVLQLNAGQVAFNRFKKHNPELTPVPARQSGFFNLYHRISGYPDNFQFTSNKSIVMDKFKESEIKRDVMRASLIDYFGPLPIFFDGSMERIDYFSDWDEADEEATYIDF